MKTILKEISSLTIEVKKSKFKATIAQVTTIEEVKTFLEKHVNTKATHNCFAYRVGWEANTTGFSSDGEPHGTAGEPLLNLIKHNNLTNIIIMVTRWFGGIKLGVGPLTRAYVKVAKDLITTLELQRWILGWEINFSVEIKNLKVVEKYLIHKQIFYHKSYNELVFITAETNQSDILEPINYFVNINNIISKYIKWN
ncbi:hypothetical protein SSABA_v1c00570 [Spiroplasma sabaudiense Ar-1343]|uniref:Impact N-terminal domain-containing protein n=1 Tax=Spiroplasma sabaudiense Ar-1343 TaxID=1276257 RepID=W6AID8_9MOLU|nr:YigZ family protein [Spiroplasma sabaudiense]AHI53469.1 hypothetical protein SSABA_v1c00570 [Spiroplasma sabaudiense Ar-1343]